MKLDRYHQKRDFKKTPEPKGHVKPGNSHRFSIQKHAASHLHYDFRIELDGVLKSWAVPKGPSLDPHVKRLAIHVEDHPIEYGTFEGIIPKGEYGGGTVLLWDKGTWIPLDENPNQAYEKGHLRFELDAEKLSGRWDLIRLKPQENAWFLIKYKDDYAKSDGYDITVEMPDSVLTHQTIEEITEDYSAVWSKKGLEKPKKKVKAKTKKYKKIALDIPISSMPKTVSPELATLVTKPPEGELWVHEIKFDGYRILAFKKAGQVTLMSRNQKDWTAQFHNIVAAVKQLPIENGIFDGEIVVLDEHSRSNFQLLQNAVKSNTNVSFIYYIFDLLYYEQWDVRNLSLIDRKKLLAPILDQNQGELKYSDHIIGQGDEFYKKSCDFSLEGIISKRSDSVYLSKRSKSWLKVKCNKRQEFIIGGFSPPQNSRSHFGSLFLGVYDNQGNLVFSGNVGTGFSQISLKEIAIKLQKLITKKNPFNSNPPGVKTATWVKPLLVAEVEFTEWTNDGHLRHPSFKGLRSDKNPKDIVKETEQPMTKEIASNSIKKPKKTNQIQLTHPEKILYKEDGITKLDLLNYYEEVAPVMLPFITNRPLTLVRCPSDYKECFYQKKLNESGTALHAVAIKNKKEDKTEDYIYLDNDEGLFNLVQMGVLEIHPWGSMIDSLEYPDIIIFDLDPDENLAWKNVVAAALEVKGHLEQFKLKSFVKTTGGKGLHVVIPIKPEYDWEDVKNFSHTFALFMEQLNPDKYLSVMSKAKRKGKIYIDYLRNQRGANAIAAYSTRAKIHAPISTPLDWDELTPNKKDTYYTIKTLPRRLEQLKHDPWKGFWSVSQSLRLDEIT